MKNKLIAFLFSPSGASKREVPNTQVSAEEIENETAFKAAGGFFVPGANVSSEELESEAAFHEAFETPFDNFGDHGALVRAAREVQDGVRGFLWETNKGEIVAPSKMATPHLFFALRMLFNHSVPPLARVGTFKRRENVDQWDVDYRSQASNAMAAELMKRKDVEAWMVHEMKDMDQNLEFLNVVFRDWLPNDTGARWESIPIPAKPITAKLNPRQSRPAKPVKVRKDHQRAAREHIAEAHAKRRMAKSRRKGAKPASPALAAILRELHGVKVQGYYRGNGNFVKGYTR